MRMLIALLIAGALGVASGVAGAASFTISPGGAITAASLGKITFETNIIGEGPACNWKLVGTVRTEAFTKTEGAEVARITSVRMTECVEGSFSGLAEVNRPWLLTYKSIAGTLPEAVTALLGYLSRVGILMSTSSFSCLYGEVKLGIGLRLTHTSGAQYTSGLLEVLAEDQLFPSERLTKLAGLFSCPTAPTFLGTLSLSPTQTLTRT